MITWFLELSLFEQSLLIYFLVINIITFFYFGLDKLRSQVAGKRRIPERTLWILSLIGGSLGALAGIKFFRHKTKKLSFQAGMAVILAVQILIIYFLFF